MRCKAEQRNEKQSGNAYGICEKCRCLLRCRKGGAFFEYFAVFSYHTVYVYGDSNARNRVERPKSSVLYGVFACGGICHRRRGVGAFFLCYSLHLSDVFFASFFCALSVLITGKIHIDGLIDTCDALGSHGEREKKLQILDDPHAGAFGIAGAVVYFLLFFGVAAELYPLLTPETAAAVFLIFAASRAMTAAQIVTMRLSKQSGLLYTFRKAASGRGTLISSAAVSLGCLAAAAASFSYAGLIPGAAGLLFCLYFRSMAARQFGGISGDLCGWLIHMQELILLLSFLPALLQLGGMADFF